MIEIDDLDETVHGFDNEASCWKCMWESRESRLKSTEQKMTLFNPEDKSCCNGFVLINYFRSISTVERRNVSQAGGWLLKIL